LLIFAFKEAIPELSDCEPDREVPYVVIDPGGDVVLEFCDTNSVHQGSCVVSTKVLSLTSPSFARMFQPGFQEADKVLIGGRPSIKIYGDEFLSMENILKTLHYQGDATADISAERLTGYAIHCDKYDFTKALKPWITLWFENVQIERDKSMQFGHVILSAYLFCDERRFAKASQEAIIQLLPCFASEWDLVDQLELLPSKVSGELLGCMEKRG
jgi:hypothetical protein